MKQSSPVSIVVTMHNAERTIERCLNSIMDLEFPRDKMGVIVVDDGSTDGSVDIVKKYPVTVIQKERAQVPVSAYADLTGEIICLGGLVG